jgi:predicted anti-sigma-YlaC factor YlaD
MLNLSCEQISRLASESLDRDIGPLERAALRSHLLYCYACRRYLRQITQLRDALRRLAARAESDPDAPGPTLPDDARERIRRALRDH